MSIYFDFPSIAEYPVYPDQFSNEPEESFPETEKTTGTKENIKIMQDCLAIYAPY